jgi:hypothetical protein
MTTTAHEPMMIRRHSWVDHLRIREMWVSVAIAAMWVAVATTAIWGPDARFNNTDGSSSTIPTAVFASVFAFLGSSVVARYGFRQQQKD